MRRPLHVYANDTYANAEYVEKERERERGGEGRERERERDREKTSKHQIKTKRG